MTVPYTVFRGEVAKQNVATIYSQGPSIEGRFTTPITWPPTDRKEPRPGPPVPAAKPRPVQNFATTLPTFVAPNFESFLIEHDVEISAVPIQSGSGWGTLLFGFGPAILIIAFYVWLTAARGKAAWPAGSLEWPRARPGATTSSKAAA